MTSNASSAATTAPSVKLDKLAEPIKYVADLDVLRRPQLDESEIGLLGVKSFLVRLVNGYEHGEVNFVWTAGLSSLILGTTYGAIWNSRQVMDDFRRRHNAHVFEGRHEGKSKLMNATGRHCIELGLKSGWRIGAFTTGLAMVVTSAMIYRNDIYVRDMTGGTALVCSLWRTRMGLRAMFAAGMIGGLLGASLASILKIAFWASGTTVGEYRYWMNVNSMNREYMDKQKEHGDRMYIRSFVHGRNSDAMTRIYERDDILREARESGNIEKEMLTDHFYAGSK